MAKKTSNINNLDKRVLGYMADPDACKHVDYILKRLGNGANKLEIRHEVMTKFKLKGVRAGTMIDTCIDMAFRVDPEYVSQIVAQIKYNVSQTLLSVDEMLENAEGCERERLLKTRMRAMDTLTKLLPTRIDITSNDVDVRKALFDLHGLED